MEGKLEVTGYRGKHFNESNNQSPLTLLFGFVHNNNGLHINTVTLFQLIERIMLFKINPFKQNHFTFFDYLDKTVIILIIHVKLQSQGVLTALKRSMAT